MDYWNTEETGEEFPHNLQRKPFGLDNEQLVELSSLPPPRFQASHQMPRGECSIRTIGSSHCASNQVDMSCGIRGDKTYRRKMKEGVEREAVEQARTSCSGGSGSSFWKTNCQSNDSSGHKRKSRDPEEYGSPSDATELESAPGSKASQKSGSARRSRVAEVHNLSDRRRRDRINEKMKALQELIPHSNKSDKASMLDEAIEYMKSLQLQIQLMWMCRGMTPMMLPGMQHYMSRVGMGIVPPMLPTIQNLMRLSKFPLVDQAIIIAPTTNLTPVGQVHYQNQMQNSSFQQQYANFMGFPNTSQPTNMFNFGFHPPEKNEVSAPRGNENGSVG
ncbi:hypothetical protein ACS0TY_030136 [Phlomoides rotata]